MYIRGKHRCQAFIQCLTTKMRAETYFFAFKPNSTSANEFIVTLDESNSNIFEDPFESLWIKISASFAFFCGLSAAIILCSFGFYQRQVYAGNYQTVINQLVSFTCLLVSFLQNFKTAVTIENLSYLLIRWRRVPYGHWHDINDFDKAVYIPYILYICFRFCAEFLS